MERWFAIGPETEKERAIAAEREGTPLFTLLPSLHIFKVKPLGDTERMAATHGYIEKHHMLLRIIIKMGLTV